MIFKIIVLLCVILSVTSIADIMEPCRYPVFIGIEQGYIPDSSLWATSHMNNQRSSKYARLNGWKGGGAWTAGSPNKYQYLGVDLGYRHVITSVITQGRRGSNEYVTEFYLEFSSDNKTWTVYSNKYGTALMFIGNDDDNIPYKNVLSYPLVARFIRFNPQRWNQYISMRIEFEGCRFDAASVSFNGDSRISYDISGEKQYVQTTKDRLKLRFRTTEANGLLFYADGNQGDYIILEMILGRLFFHIDLGSTPEVNGHTTMSAGSLLDNNQWHEVDISRNNLEVNFTVDQLTITNMTNGDFLNLDLDRQIHLGGVDTFMKTGKRFYSTQNFIGCMENAWFNYMDIISDARMGLPRIKAYGEILYGSCNVVQIVPMTFTTIDARIEVAITTGDSQITVSFNFRSYSSNSVLFFIDLQNKGKISLKINEDGYLEYYVRNDIYAQIVRNVITSLKYGSITDKFNSGLWHSVKMSVGSDTTRKNGYIDIVVDDFLDSSQRNLNFKLNKEINIGGGDWATGDPGFLGCMYDLRINGDLVGYVLHVDESKIIGMVNGSCTLQDRCNPNPCEHGGICSETHLNFECECSKTGYEGAVCHKSKYLVSCEEERQLNPRIQYKLTTLDIDDSGPLPPFKAKCIFNHETGTSITEIHHDSMERTLVDGYEDPGSYSRYVVYTAGIEIFDELINRSSTCQQMITYECWGSRLLSDPGLQQDSHMQIPSWGWWVGRNKKNMKYWGGSSPGSGKCACALHKNCKMQDTRCNCDAGLIEDNINDHGLLKNKDDLPVMELRFGDTGTLNDQSKGYHILGPLECTGDTLFDNIITFRKQDASIPFPTLGGATSMDLRFQFLTTAENGIFVQNTGRTHFIEIKIVLGNSIHFRFDVGNGVQTLEKMTAYPLNDGTWHTIHIERNRKLSLLRIDQQSPITVAEPANQGFRTLDLNSDLMIGAAVDYSDGFVGCMRALIVNGVIQDLRGKVESGEITYGVSQGCNPKCTNDPCMNEGICLEFFSHYTCDCAYTPYRGWDCGREVGVNMMPAYLIAYEFDQSTGKIATDQEDIIIGFVTKRKQGILMYITDGEPPRSKATEGDNKEYILIGINQNGGVRVALDVGFERQEINTENMIDFANGQQHVVRVRRLDRGHTLTLQVDDYPAETKNFSVSASSDTKLDNPRYIYFGHYGYGDYKDNGFEGCLFRAQFDNIYPFKSVFQDPKPDEVIKIEGVDGQIKENMCAFPEVTNKPYPAEFRPTTQMAAGTTTPTDPDVVWGTDDGTDSFVIGGIVAGLLLLMAIALFVVCRYYFRQKGAYQTNEAKSARGVSSADTAVTTAPRHSQGPPAVKKEKEYYI